jgi:hypothetical protein
MKRILQCLVITLMVMPGAFAQSDNEKLALAISEADAANIQKLKAYIWKRKSDVLISGELKLTVITEFSFDASGKLQAKAIDSKSTVKKKPGLRGKMQKNAAEDKAEYVEKALEVALSYTYMSKGQLLDFFSRATVTRANGVIEATGKDVNVKGDQLIIRVEEATNLYLSKKFSSLVGKDAIDGELNYEKFSSGINHGSTTILNLPAQQMRINAVNQDYSQRVN